MTEDIDLDTDDNPSIAEIRASRDEAVAEAKQAKRELAVTRALPTLNARQVTALLADKDLDVSDAEAIKSAAVELGWVSAEPEPTDEPEVPAEDEAASERITEATSGGTPPAAGVITPAEVAEWTPEKIDRFASEHPGAFDELLQGKEVSGVTA